MHKSKAPILEVDQVITAPIDAFSAMSGIGRTKISEMVKNGDIAAVKIGKRTLIMVDSYRRYLKLEHDRVRSKARQAVYNALQNGSLIKRECEHCGSSDNVQAHHESYTRPLDVRWLCKSCYASFYAKQGRRHRL